MAQILASGNKTGNNISYTSATSSPYVLQELRRLAESSRTGKVTIIAHSNGGLVAKALMQQLGSVETAKLVDKVVFVAVPQIGTPLTVASLLHGEELGIAPLLSANASRIIGQNMPGIYNLLPSTSYFSNVTDPVITFDPATMSDWTSKYGSIVHDSAGLRAFMTDSTRTKPVLDDLVTPEINNPVLFDAAQTVHDQLDSWIPPVGVQVVDIAGWGNETFSGIVYKKVRSSCVLGTVVCFGGYALTYSPQHVIDGDGTVVTASALWANGALSTRYWVDLPSYNINNRIEATPFGRVHRDILEVPQLRALLANILTATTTAPLPQYISTLAPSFTGTGNRLHFTLHSPLTLGFTDVSGNYTGATATSTIFNIPGVQYEKYGDVQWISIPEDIAGKLVMHGTASGSFTLDAEGTSGNEVMSTTSFEGISSATSTIATIDIDPFVS
ncbi:MAG: alpha/beta hydrolase, partial [Candidatus Saccharibacteria bacterium]|nr:alpha/beta hydrolase [Candidatus Saccharibacteria bacterium]